MKPLLTIALLLLVPLAERKTLQIGKVNAPFELKQGEDLTLRIFIDKNLVEVFANERQAALAANRYDPDNLTIPLFSKGGDTLVKQVRAWTMKTIYPGEPDADKKAKEELK